MTKLDDLNTESVGSTSHSVYHALRERIVTLQLAPGEQVSDKALSQEFRVSRTPVREAILRLAEEKMVYILPNSGTFVSPIQPDALNNAHFIRRTLECASLRESRPFSKATQRRLRALFREQTQAETSADPAEFYKLDDAFHRFLMEATDHAEAWLTVDRVKAQIDRVRYLAVSDGRRKGSVLEQHARIVDAVEAEDPAQTAGAMEAHLNDSFAALMRTIAAYRSYIE